MFHWYGLIVGIAIVTGYSVAEWIEPKVNKVAPWVIVIGLLGARTYHVIDLWWYYQKNLGQIVAVWNGGMSIWGGLIGGGLGLLIYYYTIKSIDNMASVLGAIVTALPLAQAIGRIANGVNHEFMSSVWILPWWSAELICDLVLFGIIFRLGTRAPWLKVLIYLFGYGTIRYVLQPYR